MMQSDSFVANISFTTTDQNAEMHQLYSTLKEYVLLEHKFQPKLCLPTVCEDNSEVTVGSRDGAANVLRCLKVWFDLPSEVFIDAVSLFDRFLTKMKVRPCHVPCITMSCMDIALEQYCAVNNITRTISVDELLSVSKSACTARDVQRMALVISDKLCLAGGSGDKASVCGVTSLHWARAALAVTRCGAARLQLDGVVPEESEFAGDLEWAFCDTTCVSLRTPALVLGLLQQLLENRLVKVYHDVELPPGVYTILEFIEDLLTFCNVTQEEARWAAAVCLERIPRRRRAPLIWRLSRRTLESLRPTDRLTSLLPTIEEQGGDVTRLENGCGSKNDQSY